MKIPKTFSFVNFRRILGHVWECIHFFMLVFGQPRKIVFFIRGWLSGRSVEKKLLNAYVTLYWSFIQTFYTVSREATGKKLSYKYVFSKSSQFICQILLEDELLFLVNLLKEGLWLPWKWTPFQIIYKNFVYKKVAIIIIVF